MPVKILMLSWEYPPYKIGGIAEHVGALSRALARGGHEVHVVTPGRYGGYEQQPGGVHLHRIEVDPYTPDYIARMNEGMKEFGASIIYGYDIDVIHAHDWMVSDAAIELAKTHRIPLVATMHSTEFGRSGGIKEAYQMRIHEKEQRLVSTADHVIVCSESMKKELKGLFGIGDNISVVPNGVEVSKFSLKIDRGALKSRFCGSRDTKMILFLGRLVYQKGVNVLIGAMPRILAECPDTKLVIVGEGPMRMQLEREAFLLGVAEHVVFTGYLDDYTVRCLLKAADVLVMPSMYEPFGIVVLEAMAARVPVVASDVGGISELINDGEGLKVPPDNSYALADAIVAVLTGEDVLDMVERGYNKAIAMDWDGIAEATAGIYMHVLTSATKREELKSQSDRNDYRDVETGDLWQYRYS